MTNEQKLLVEQNLPIVKYVLWKVKPYGHSIFGLNYEDLYQEGSIALCKAVLFYQKGKGASFQTFAEIVVRNHIINYLKKCHAIQYKDKQTKEMAYEIAYCHDESKLYVLEFIKNIRNHSNDTTKKGIDALMLKMIGYRNQDIAKMYGVKSSLVWAWISRAVEKIKLDKETAKLSA